MMRMSWVLRATVAPAVMALCMTGAAMAQSPAGARAHETGAANTAAQVGQGVGEHSTPGTLSQTDQAFLKDSAQGANYELALANLAKQKASKPDVRLYAQTLVTDHDKLNAGLTHLAQQKGVQLPSGMSKDNQSKLNHMKSLSGSAFDHAFTTEEARINAQDKEVEEREIGATQDNDVKAFVQQMQVADANHQKMSQGL